MKVPIMWNIDQLLIVENVLKHHAVFIASPGYGKIAMILPTIENEFSGFDTRFIM